jgi:hypothetical protein
MGKNQDPGSGINIPDPQPTETSKHVPETFNFIGILWQDKTKDKFDRITIRANNAKTELISCAQGSGFKPSGESRLGSKLQINASLSHIRHKILKLKKIQNCFNSTDVHIIAARLKSSVNGLKSSYPVIPFRCLFCILGTKLGEASKYQKLEPAHLVLW